MSVFQETSLSWIDELNAIDDLHLCAVRYTFAPEQDTPDRREAMITQIIKVLSSAALIKYYTLGYEKYRSRYPHTHLPAKPHVHLALSVQCSKYDLSCKKGQENWKASIRRKLQSYVAETGTPWGTNRLFINIEKPKETVDIFQYPLKQGQFTDWLYHDWSRGFTPKELNEMKIRSQTMYQMNKTQSEKQRERLDTEGMSVFYKELKEKLDLLTSDKPLDIYREIYRYYCQKSKPINTQTIQGYYLTHCFQNNIISLDKFIKHTHSKTLSF